MQSYYLLMLLMYHVIMYHARLCQSRRPFYNMAHMVNSIRLVDHYLRLGANSIETDITFGANGSPLYTYHGFPCDCLRYCERRESIARFLSYIREISTKGEFMYPIVS